MKTYEQFLLDLAGSESSGRYDAVNSLGYLGKYQMGEPALVDSGYYKSDGNKEDNRFSDQFWTGKDGVKSKAGFLNNRQAQENAIREYMKIQWRYILASGSDRFVGQTIKGYLITTSGILAGAHLGGWRSLALFLKTGVVAADKNKVPVTRYIKKFAGHETPFVARKKLTGLKKDNSRKTTMYQIDNSEWLPKESAIQMVRDGVLDGVVVTNSKGTIFLKTRPDGTTVNNLSQGFA